MKIYIYIESSELEDIAEAASKSIESWVSEPANNATFVNSRSEESDELQLHID